MATINQIVYTTIKNDTRIIDAYNKFFYLVNDNKVKQPFATIFMVDDPKDKEFLCVDGQGQSRFQCDTFTKTFVKGIDKREIYIKVVEDLNAQTISGFNIWNVEILNLADRPDTINGLFQFSFEVIIHWTK